MALVPRLYLLLGHGSTPAPASQGRPAHPLRGPARGVALTRPSLPGGPPDPQSQAPPQRLRFQGIPRQPPPPTVARSHPSGAPAPSAPVALLTAGPGCAGTFLPLHMGQGCSFSRLAFPLCSKTQLPAGAGCGPTTRHHSLAHSLVPRCWRPGPALGPGNSHGSCLALTFRGSGSSRGSPAPSSSLFSGAAAAWHSLRNSKGFGEGVSTALGLSFPL